MSENNTSNEIEVVSKSALVDQLGAMSRGEAAGILTWLEINDQDDALAAFDAVTASVPLADNIGKAINMTNAIFQEVELLNEETGELESSVRVTILDDKGNAFHATSSVVFRSLRTLFAFVGTPNKWTKPVPVQAVRGGTGRRQFIEIKRAAKG